MKVNLIKPDQYFELDLPDKIKGLYWLQDIDENGRKRKLISIEAIGNQWVVKSNRMISLLDAEGKIIDKSVLTASSFFILKYRDSSDRIILFAEGEDQERRKFKKYILSKPTTILIGRLNSANLVYANQFTSSKHAALSYTGEGWQLEDMNSTNGTYVNHYRFHKDKVYAGDVIYIMGLVIIIGANYFAVNNPENLLEIHSADLLEFIPQEIQPAKNKVELPEKKYFFRSPRFHREIEHQHVQIDAPPQPEKLDTVPMALMLGPAITMGMTSVMTAMIAVNNVISNGGEITQALPMIIMAVGMLLGTVLWPILTKKYEKKKKAENEHLRQVKYFEYLDEKRDEIKEIGKVQKDILIENNIAPEECAQRVETVSSKLWERVIGQEDFLNVRLGIGTIPMDLDVDYQEKHFSMEDDNLQDAMIALGKEKKELENVPVSISLTANTSVGIYGNAQNTYNLLHTIVLQLVTLHSYDEVKVMLLIDEEDAAQWNFVKFIPHFWTDDKTVRFYAASMDEMKELSSFMEGNIIPRLESRSESYTEYAPYYVIITTSEYLSKKCEPLQLLLKEKENRACSVFVSAREMSALPKETRMVIHANGDQSKIFEREDTSGKMHEFIQDAVIGLKRSSWIEDIATIELDNEKTTYALPNMISFLDMFGVSKIEFLNVLTRWKENNPTKTLQTPVGVDTYGELFYLDLHEKFHGPHGLVAGMTGSGKSEFIITYILSLAVNYHPDEVAFILIDYKGGGLTGAFEDDERGIKLPHLAGTITNLDGAAIKRSLVSIQSELRRRQAIFNEARKVANEGTMDIYKYQQLYRDKVVTEPVPHLFIISDEFAELKSQQPEFMEQLISAARIGRSLGVHLILATQKPNGVVDDQIWSNSKFRVCLKVQDKADSQDMIKRPDAAELSQTGRFYLQVGFNELFALGQSAWCGADYIPSDTMEKAVDNSVQMLDNLGRVAMSLKPNVKQTKSDVKQVVAIVKYLSEIAEEEHIAVRSLWLAPIPAKIYIDDLEEKYQTDDTGFALNPVIGEYDDPFNQKQDVLTLPLTSEGNCIVYGATGNGKTTFLTTLVYSLIKHHSAKEINLYLLDFGSETLRAFAGAPQVGGVVVSSDEEKVINLMKMLVEEMDYRKNLFAEYGGDHSSYCKNSGESVPNIVVIINNYSGFAEQFENLDEVFNLLSRDGVKYGMYFVLSAGATNAVRYRTQQNFKNIFTMQLNDETDYPILVGKTDGLLPSKYKGRGLVALDKVYEFQTAYCHEEDDLQNFLRSYCISLAENTKNFARNIPVLPEIVNYQAVRAEVTGLDHVPVGVGKKDLRVGAINLEKTVVYPIVVQELLEATRFIEEFIGILGHIGNVYVLDAEKILVREKLYSANVIDQEFESFVIDLFAEMVQRNNDFKDSKMDMAALEKYDERVYVLMGWERFHSQLSEDAKEKMSLLIEKAESFYKIHFVLVETQSMLSSLNYEAWYKRHVTGKEGIWMGEGIADQYVLKINKITSNLYEEITPEYGYLLTRGKPTLIKLLSSETEEVD